MPGHPLLSVLAGVSGPTSRCVRAGGFSPRLWLGGEEAQQPECAVVHLAAHQSQGKSLKTRPGRGSNQSDGDDLAEMTKRQLYELAQDLGVDRRSSMDRSGLEAAVRAARTQDAKAS